MLRRSPLVVLANTCGLLAGFGLGWALGWALAERWLRRRARV